jgi:hypothetical protein|tara:strand:+ start:66 stop:251 length:186 start_codon:yes stop_codon:yes gene_type:complete
MKQKGDKISMFSLTSSFPDKIVLQANNQYFIEKARAVEYEIHFPVIISGDLRSGLGDVSGR